MFREYACSKRHHRGSRSENHNLNGKFCDFRAHEMGHNLGLTHSEGLMHTHTGGNSITIFNISESLAQLQECFVEKTNTLRKKIELGIVPDKISYVGVVANHEEPIIS